MAGGAAVARESEHVAEGLIAKAAEGGLRRAAPLGEAAAKNEIRAGAKDMLGRTADQFDDSLTKDMAADLRSSIGKTFDDADPGPLSKHYSSTFADGEYTVGMLDEQRRFMRAGDLHNGRERPDFGEFWTDTPPHSVEAVRRDLAVKDVWPDGTKSQINHGFEDVLPPGTVFYYGEVGSQGGKYVGGGMQYLIQTPWELTPKPINLSHWPLAP